MPWLFMECLITDHSECSFIQRLRPTRTPPPPRSPFSPKVEEQCKSMNLWQTGPQRFKSLYHIRIVVGVVEEQIVGNGFGLKRVLPCHDLQLRPFSLQSLGHLPL